MSASRAVTYRLLLVLGLLLAGLPSLVPTPGAAAEAGLDLPRAETPVAIQRGGQTIWARPLKTVRVADGREAVAGRLIVGFQPGASAQAADVHRQAGARARGAARAVATLGREAQVVAVADTVALDAAVAAYRADERVRYAEPDYVLRALETPSDPAFAQQWGLRQIAAPAAWSISHGSTGQLIAILDCGIHEPGAALANGRPGHPDLAGKVVARRDFTGAASGADDYCNHGTHVAGIAAAVTNNALGVAGVGYDTRLLNGKVLDDFGSGSISSVAQGITWAAESGARVINMSLGANFPCVTTLQEAIDDAWARQVVIVAAAGNDNLSTPHLPASCDHVLAVASTDASDSKSAFSSHGDWVDVAAPGGRDDAGNAILSTDNTGGYVRKSGTSMAAPHVAGLAGLLWGSGRATTAQAVVERVTSTADRIAGTGLYWQYGRVNAAAALGYSVAPPPGSTPTLGALTWYFAEGYTGPGFDEYLTILNPNASGAAVTITYYLGDGATQARVLTVAAGTRATVVVHEPALGVGRGQSVAARVASTNGVGIVVERPMYFRYGTITGGHVTLGATAPARDWYFAEGYTGPGFDEYLTLLNPHDGAAAVLITYYLGEGATRVTEVALPARGRATIAVHDPVQGVGRDRAVAAHVTTTHPGGIVAERPIYFTYRGGGGTVTGGHVVLGATAPARAWYFAEGYTGPGFDEYLIVFNPGATPAPVTITYTLSDGTTRARPLTVAAGSRATIAAHDPTQGVGRDQATAATVTTTASPGIVVERAMYFTYRGVDGGHAVLGATAPARAWYFAEGYTGPGFDEYLTILNPGAASAPVTITYTLGDGATRTRQLTVAAGARATVAVHDPLLGVGRDQAVAATVTTTSADGIVVERPIYFTYGDGITGGHVVMGARERAPD